MAQSPAPAPLHFGLVGRMRQAYDGADNACIALGESAQGRPVIVHRRKERIRWCGYGTGLTASPLQRCLLRKPVAVR